MNNEPTEPIVYATVNDLETYWRPLAEDETDRAEDVLSIASSRLRVIASNQNIDLDARYEDADYANVLKWVVMEATKRTLNTPTNVPPVDTYSQTAGPYSENYKFTNPSGDLWFRKAELQALGLSGDQKIESLSPTTRGDIYKENN